MIKKMNRKIRFLLRFKLQNRTQKYKKFLNDIEYFAQAEQDLFALVVNDFKKNGTYVEVGAQDPIKINNSYILEKNYNWKGVSFEIKEDYGYFFNWFRKNPCIIGDATTTDYEKEFKKINLPSQIDYLQIDIDPADKSLQVLKRMPLDKYRFSAITFEHDQYSFGDDAMNESRKILSNNGYILYASNVKHKGDDFEDWWIDSKILKENKKLIRKYENIESVEIIKDILQEKN